ncbi:hypothetical protein C2G38_2229151 [Gigaspora rosea]|uniref:Uncharacterized protein n=1 Tax=Gigaspora rosea TaxID=44941 RepID=A0A397TYT2_9GLOM|nr:hypothetical protein C2G38_2229151 [Gigaspora rosea]
MMRQELDQELRVTIAYLESQCILDPNYEHDFKSDIYRNIAFSKSKGTTNFAKYISSNIKSETDKEFNEDILKAEQLGLKIIVENLKNFDFGMNFEVEHRETILAYFYMKGFGTSEDYKKGYETKDVNSHYEVAFCYRYSLGTFEDYKKAVHYFNLVVSGKVLKDKRELDMERLGCKENKTKAFAYLKKPANRINLYVL